MRHFVSLVLPRGDATVYRPSVCPSVTFRYRLGIGWNTSKIISPPNSDKIVMWRIAQSSADFALTYNFQGTHIYIYIHWAHRAVIFVTARLSCFILYISIIIIIIIIRPTLPRVDVSFTQNDYVRAHLGHVRVIPRNRLCREVWILLPPRIPRRSLSENRGQNFEFYRKQSRSTWFDRRFAQNLQKKFDTRTRSNPVRHPSFSGSTNLAQFWTPGVILGSTGPTIRYGKFPLRRPRRWLCP